MPAIELWSFPELVAIDLGRLMQIEQLAVFITTAAVAQLE